jgi:hypothetical protein
VAINAHEREIVIVHQRVNESWIHFIKSDDDSVREDRLKAMAHRAIMDEIAMAIEDPKSYGMRCADEIPAAWLYDESKGKKH